MLPPEYQGRAGGSDLSRMPLLPALTPFSPPGEGDAPLIMLDRARLREAAQGGGVRWRRAAEDDAGEE
jgi:hypothetical protein